MGTFPVSLWLCLARRSLPKECLCNMRFAVFGLGDSGYAKYNATARKLHARLLQLGASELVSFFFVEGVLYTVLLRSIITSYQV